MEIIGSEKEVWLPGLHVHRILTVQTIEEVSRQMVKDASMSLIHRCINNSGTSETYFNLIQLWSLIVNNVSVVNFNIMKKS